MPFSATGHTAIECPACKAAMKRIKARLDDLWARYDSARRAGFFSDALRLKDEYKTVLLALDAKQKA